VLAFAELEHYNTMALLQHVHRSLSGLSRVIRGASLLDVNVSALADDLLKRETPADWQRLWEGPDDPLDYARAICGKAGEVRKWLDAARQVCTVHHRKNASDWQFIHDLLTFRDH